MKIASAVIKKDGKFLIGKRSAEKEFAPGQWEFISGFIERNEPPEETIKREIQEEIGCGVKSIKPLPPYETTDQDGKWEISPFLVDLDAEPKLGPDHSELKWVSWGVLKDYPELLYDVKLLGELK